MDNCALRSNQRLNLNWIVLIFTFLLSVTMAAAQNDAVKIPAEVQPFVEKGMIPIALELGDLNADGRKDFVLVLSKIIPKGSVFDEAGDALRPTIVLIRDESGRLTVAS